MATCNPSHPACLKSSGPTGAKFCTACGAAAASVLGDSVSRPAYGRPQVVMTPQMQAPRPSQAQYQWSPGAAAMPNLQARPSGASGLKSQLVSTLAQQRHHREPASLSLALMAAGGTLLGLAIAALILEVYDGDYDTNTAVGFLVALVAIAGLWFAAKMLPRPFVVAATSALNLVVPVTVGILTTSMLSEGKLGLPLLLGAIVLVGFWSLPGFMGRPSLLGIALILGVTGLGYLTAQSRLSGNDIFEYFDELNYIEFVARETSIVVMLLGIGLLVAAWNFDRKGWPNLGTPFIAAGVFASSVGAFGLIGSGDFSDGGSIALLVMLSASILFVGGISQRRATTWIGTTLVTSGLVALVSWLLSDESSPGEFAIFAAIMGASVAFGAFRVGPVIAARARGTGNHSLTP